MAKTSRKKQNNATFDTAFLLSLVETAKSCVKLINFKQHLSLHPSQIETFEQSLKEELGIKVPKYDQKLNGIVLGYKNINVLSQLGLIFYDSPFLHFDVQGDFFVFQPLVGTKLNGVVVKTSHDHVACLVYRSFNVSLPEFECTDQEQWLGHSVNIGDEVRFKITFVDMELRIPYIRGKLISIISSATNNIKTNENEINGVKLETKKLKHKLNNSRESELDNNAQSYLEDQPENVHIPNNKSKSKNKKSHQVTNHDTTFDDEINESDLQQNKHKKLKNNSNNKSKKHKRSQEETEINEEILDDADNTVEDTPKLKGKHKSRGSKLIYETENIDETTPVKQKIKVENFNDTQQKINKKSKNKSSSFTAAEQDLENFFNQIDQVNNIHSSNLLIDEEDRGKRRKRSNSLSHVVSLNHIKLEPDSEWENTPENTSGKKRKRAVSESERPKKKKHKSSM